MSRLILTNSNSLCGFVLNTDLKVVQEYERAVIFRLGRLRKGGAKVIKERNLALI